MLRRFRLHWPGNEQGQALLEFAITFLLLLTVVFAIIEFCSLIYTYTVLADAANEGLRYAVVNSATATAATVNPIVKQYAALSLHNVAAISVTFACSGTGGSCAPPNDATITVSYPYLPY